MAHSDLIGTEGKGNRLDWREERREAPFIDREVIHAKIKFFSSAVAFMDDHRDDFDDSAFFAVSIMLSGIAREVYPEAYTESEPGQNMPANLLVSLLRAIPACSTPGDVAYGYEAAQKVLVDAGWNVTGQASL